MSTTINPRMGTTDWALLILLSVLWGGSFFFNAVALADLPPLSLVAARLVVAATILWLATGLLGRRVPRTASAWRAFLAMGLINNAVPFTLIVWGQTQIASSVAAILNASTPLWTVLLAHALTDDERLTPGRLAGVLAGLGGVAVMVGGASVAAAGTSVVAQLACLGAAMSYAVGGVYGRRFRTLGITPLAGATGQVTVSALVVGLLALVIDQPWTLPAPGAPALAAVAAVGSLSTALAYVVFFGILARAGATNLLLVTFLVPVTAILLGVAILGEVLLPRHLAGMALIGAGLAAIDGRPLAALRGSVGPR